MRLFDTPRLSQVVTLLGQCGLPSDDLLEEYLSNFVLVVDGGTPIGVAGLQVFGPAALVRSVGVAPAYRKQGLGAELLAALETKARDQDVRHLYLLTNDAQTYFARHGWVSSLESNPLLNPACANACRERIARGPIGSPTTLCCSAAQRPSDGGAGIAEWRKYADGIFLSVVIFRYMGPFFSLG